MTLIFLSWIREACKNSELYDNTFREKKKKITPLLLAAPFCLQRSASFTGLFSLSKNIVAIVLVLAIPHLRLPDLDFRRICINTLLLRFRDLINIKWWLLHSLKSISISKRWYGGPVTHLHTYPYFWPLSQDGLFLHKYVQSLQWKSQKGVQKLVAKERRGFQNGCNNLFP